MESSNHHEGKPNEISEGLYAGQSRNHWHVMGIEGEKVFTPTLLKDDSTKLVLETIDNGDGDRLDKEGGEGG